MRKNLSRLLVLFLCSVGILRDNVYAGPREVSIGLLAELSGPFSSIGEDCRRGYKVAFTSLTDSGRIGQYIVKPLYGDHQRDPKIGLAEFNRFVEQHVLAIASNSSGVVMALNPSSRGKSLPLLGISAHPKFVSGNDSGYRFWLNARVEGAGLATRAIQSGYRSAAMLTLEDDYPLAVTDGFRDEFKKRGGEVTFDDRILKTETEFTSLAVRIRKTKPDVLFINIVGDQLPLVIRKFREQQLSQPILATFSLGKSEYIESAGKANVEGATFLDIDGQKPKFAARLKDAYGVTLPTGLHYTCYAAVGFFLEALRANPNIRTSADLDATMKGIQTISLLDGAMAIAGREAQFDYGFRTVRSGQVVDSTN